MSTTQPITTSQFAGDPLGAADQGLNVGRPPAGAIPRRTDGVPVPLSYPQQRLWFLAQLRPWDAAYNLAGALRLHFALDLQRLRRSLEEIVRRHEALRAVFPAPDGTPRQVFTGSNELQIPLTDLSAVPRSRREAEVAQLATREAIQPFDLSSGPLLRASVLRLSPVEYVLLLTAHHIVADGWSMGILLRELECFYSTHARGDVRPLPELPIQYGDYAVWQRAWLGGRNLGAQLAYWRKHLAGMTALRLPTDRPHPKVSTGKGERLPVRLPPELSAAVEASSRRHGVTPFMTLLAGFLALLARYAGQDDVTVGVPVAGRNRAELEGLIGFFVNSLIFRADLSGDPTFAELLKRVRETALEAFSNQDVPFEMIVDELKPERDLGRNPLYQVTFQYMTLPTDAGVDRAKASPPAFVSGPPGPKPPAVAERRPGGVMFDLAMDLWPGPDGIEGRVDYSTDLFDADTIRSLVDHYQHLLQSALADPSTAVGRLEILSPEERRRILEEWAPGPAMACESGLCLHHLFERQAAQTPDAVAVCNDGATAPLTYRQLNGRANRLAGRLCKAGVGPDVLVAVCAERSPELVVAILAVLKAGGAYMPVDPTYPAERIEFMLQDAGAAVVLTHSRLLPIPGLPAHRVICLDAPDPSDGNGCAGSETHGNRAGGPGPGNLAYVIYTSGSTGRPKGVMIEHRAACNHMAWMQGRFPLGPDDRVLQRTAMSFDASVWEFHLPLLSGARLVMAPPERHQDGADLVRMVHQNGITILQMVPTLFRLFVEEPDLDRCLSLRRVFCGGEAMPVDACRTFASRNAAELVNLYGPTEVTIDATFHVYRDEADGLSATVPIGRPIGNVRAYVVDGRGRLAGMGVPGELWLGGAGVGRGYLGREELTRERFVEDPFAREGEGLGGRAYRTGDRARWLPGGTLQYLGRTEAGQVKVRGQRIELGEVEAALLAHPGVAAAAAAVRDAALVAYAVPRRPAREDGPDGEPPLGPNLREHLRRMLPEGLVPSAIVLLDALPTTPGGKLDRDALPEPEREALQLSHEYEPPRTDAERALARIWGDLLQVGRIGIHDNFFELGGDSILSIQVIARANKAGFRLLPKQLFENQSIAELAGVAGLMPFVPDEGHPEDDMAGPVGLAPIQHWFLGQCEQSQARVSSFVRSITIHLAPGANVHALQQAMTSLMERHDALRFRFEGSGRDRRQRDLGPEAAAVLRRVDLKEVPEPDREAAIAATLADELREGIDPTRGPALRAVLFDLGTAVPVRLQVLVHALSADLRSCLILAQDLQRMHGGPAALGWHSSRPFRNWVSRLLDRARHPELLRELQYWSSADREGSRFPKDILNHGDTPTGAGTGSFPAPVTAPDAGDREDDAVSVQLDAAETAMIRKTLPAACMGTAEDVLLAAVARALAAWTGSISTLVHWERACCVPPVDEQATEEANRLTVGWLATCFPVCLKADPADSAAASLRSIKEQLRAVPNGGTGYGILQHLCPDAAVRQWLDTPAADRGDSISFSFEDDTPEERQQPEPDGGLLLAPPEVSPLQRSPAAPHPFAISAGIYRGRLHLRWRFDRDRCSRETTGKLVRSFVAELRALAEQCRAPGAGLAPSDFSMARISKRDLGVLLSQLRRVEMPGKGRPGPATAAAEDDPAAKGTTKRNGAGNGGARNGGSLP